jgi:AraC-like DNA-binding protein
MPKSKNPLWLSQAREFRPPLDESRLIWLRHGTTFSGAVVPTPEFHPCCEFSIIFSGSVLITTGGEEAIRKPGDVFLVPPGLPHDSRIIKYPVRYCAVFFEPFLLVEMMPHRDGKLLLNRFLARQTLSSRLFRPSGRLRSTIISGFEEMIQEATAQSFGYEIRLRNILLDLLVHLHRSEISSGCFFAETAEHANWRLVCAALGHLREHFSEIIYARDLAKAVGASPSRLRSFFHDLLGTTWGECLNTIRIQHAAGMLGQSDKRVAEIAFACGFETLSHFNTRFIDLMGQTPTDYRARIK